MAFSFPIPSHSHKLQSLSHACQTFVPIPVIFPYRHYHSFAFPFRIISYINDCVEQLLEIVATLSFVRHITIVLVAQHKFMTQFLTQFTIVLQKTEINHTTGLCVKAANKEHKV